LGGCVEFVSRLVGSAPHMARSVGQTAVSQGGVVNTLEVWHVVTVLAVSVQLGEARGWV